MKEFIQVFMQMESILSCKYKADEINNKQNINRVFEIVTNAFKWYFIKYSLDNKGKSSFKLLESVTIIYKDNNL